MHTDELQLENGISLYFEYIKQNLLKVYQSPFKYIDLILFYNLLIAFYGNQVYVTVYKLF